MQWSVNCHSAIKHSFQWPPSQTKTGADFWECTVTPALNLLVFFFSGRPRGAGGGDEEETRTWLWTGEGAGAGTRHQPVLKLDVEGSEELKS